VLKLASGCVNTIFCFLFSVDIHYPTNRQIIIAKRLVDFKRMSYQQNPSFMPATWPLSQSYPPYCGSGMASFETSTMPCMNIYEGSGRVGAEANVGQVMVPVPVYLYQHIPPVRSYLISAGDYLN